MGSFRICPQIRKTVLGSAGGLFIALSFPFSRAEYEGSVYIVLGDSSDDLCGRALLHTSDEGDGRAACQLGDDEFEVDIFERDGFDWSRGDVFAGAGESSAKGRIRIGVDGYSEGREAVVVGSA